jgi:hypothetical protein
LLIVVAVAAHAADEYNYSYAGEYQVNGRQILPTSRQELPAREKRTCDAGVPRRAGRRMMNFSS